MVWTSGCGFNSVEENFGTHGSIEYYDSKTGKLTGAVRIDDVPWPLEGCRDFAFIAGQVRPSCQHLTTLFSCPATVGSDAFDGGTAGRGGGGRTDAGSYIPHDASPLTGEGGAQ